MRYRARQHRDQNPLTHDGTAHVSHRLVQLGLTCYLMVGFGGMVASYVAHAGRFDAYLAVGLLVVVLITGIVYFERYAPYHDVAAPRG